VGDVVKVLIKSSSSNIFVKKKIFNICASQPVKVTDLLHMLNIKIKNKSKIIFKNKRRGEMIKTYGSNNLLRKNFKIKKFTNIDEGLDKTISAFKKYNY
jgi:nucleoside-diphosphate-sugar epimerase